MPTTPLIEDPFPLPPSALLLSSPLLSLSSFSFSVQHTKATVTMMKATASPSLPVLLLYHVEHEQSTVFGNAPQ
ncbi:hypothetical protein LY78DRAFT_662275 [Colletotrichum sublineola]|nr:hypothetical protein LY78DRAFT_662275 [Colletotrichum sublineola]